MVDSATVSIARIRYLALFGVCLAVVVVVLGAYTRLVDAGLGCPDWPGCYGFLGVPESAQDLATAERLFPDAPVEVDKAWAEMVHRYFAGGLGLVVLGIAVLCWRARRSAPLALGLLVLICCQAAFGAWTVTLKLWPQIVTAHLLGGFATLSLLWVLYLRLGGAPRVTRDYAHLRGHARAALLIVVCQIALGGWVSSNYAALACPDFPACMGSYWPQMDMGKGFNLTQAIGPNYLGGLLDSEARIAIHWSHRLGAIAVLLVVGSLALRMFSGHRVMAISLAAILAVQVGLGIGNVVWVLPLSVATLHNACGALLLLGMVTVNFAPFLSSAQNKRIASGVEPGLASPSLHK